MHRRIAVVFALALVVLGGLAPPASAQLSENLGPLTGENARKYLTPLSDALSGTINSAIFTTGNVPKTGLNFAIGVKVMGVKFADEDRLYAPTDPTGFSGPSVPTVVGDENSVPHTGPGGAEIGYPGGFNIDEFAFAAPQLSIGSVAGTSVTVRWFAHTFSEADAVDQDFIEKISFFGIGGQHSLSQYFPGLPLDLAAGVFYQSFDINEDLLEMKALHFDLTGSKKFSLLQPYAAVGFDSFKMDASYEDADDPNNTIAVDFERSTHVHLTAGVLANLAFLKLHAEANIAQVNGLAVGLSFGK